MALLTAKAIANEALVQLMINMAASSMFYRGLEPQLAGDPKTGGTISIRRPAAFVAQEFETDIVEQDANESEVEMKIEKHFDVSIPITSKDLTFSLSDFSGQIVAGAMKTIAEKFEVYIMSKASEITHVVGAPGNPIDTLPELMTASAWMSQWLIPLGGRVGIISPIQAAGLKSTESLVRADARADQGVALREAQLGRTGGIDFYESQAVYRHVAGTLSNGTNQTAKAPATGAGATAMVATDTILTGTVVPGDIFTIAGMADDEGVPYHFRVSVAATAAGNTIGLQFSPALPKPVLANAVITLMGTHKAGIAGNPNGLAWACIPPAAPMGTDKVAVATYRGLGIRVVMGYDQRKKKDIISFDTFAAAKVIQPELMTRWVS